MTHRFIVSLAGVLFVLAGCGGPPSVASFSDQQMLISVSTQTAQSDGTPRKLGVAIMLMSQDRSCSSLPPGTLFTMNGAAGQMTGRGGCAGFTSSTASLSASYDVGSSVEDANLVISDGESNIEVEVEKLLGARRLVPQRPDFHLDTTNVQASEVDRGEALVFSGAPEGMELGELSATFTELDGAPRALTPKVQGDLVTLTIPADARLGSAKLQLFATSTPKVLRCQGVKSCVADVLVAYLPSVMVMQ